MPNEPIDEQLKKAEPEGVAGRWVSWVFSKKGLTVLVVCFGVWLMWRSPKPQGPVQAASRLRPTIVEAPGTSTAPVAAPPKQTVVSDPVPPPSVSAAQAEAKEDPIKALQEERRQRLMKAAFESNLTLESKEDTPPSVAASPASPLAPLPGLPTTPKPLYLIPEGTVAEAVLDSRLEGELTGSVDAHVSTDVYLPGTRTLVLPQGAKLLGEATKVGAFGQQRLAVTFHKAQIFRDGQLCNVELARDPGLDQQGATGLTGKVNNHLLSLILATSAVGIIQGASLSFAYNSGAYSPSAGITQGLSSGGSQAIERVLEPFINRVPRITVFEGTRMKLRFIRDTPSSCEVSE